jgi:hypothetical protein
MASRNEDDLELIDFDIDFPLTPDLFEEENKEVLVNEEELDNA